MFADYIWHFSQVHAIQDGKFVRWRIVAPVIRGNLVMVVEHRVQTGKDAVLKHSVVLVGMMGAGKTAVGTALSRILNIPFLDSDEEIAKAANMSVAEIFKRDGEAFFRARESEILMRLLGSPPSIISTGGGAFLAPQNRIAISTHGVSVWLSADLELLWQRVRHKTTRPLLRTADPKGTLGALYAARAPLYALADITVTSEADYSIEDMANKVIAALAAHGDLTERK
jgi:shikimate kinase